MKYGSSIAIALFLLAVAFTIWFRFDQYVKQGNYTILATTVCDPTTQECFVADCDASDELCDKTPYQKVSILAADAPICLKEYSCETFSCGMIDSCVSNPCSEETLEEGEVCFELPVYEPETEESLEIEVRDETTTTEEE